MAEKLVIADVVRYSDGETLATGLEFAWDAYIKQAQQPEGLISLDDAGSLTTRYGGLPAELDDLPCETTIFLRESQS